MIELISVKFEKKSKIKPNVHPGPDSVVRSATIKTENSELERPVVKLLLRHTI